MGEEIDPGEGSLNPRCAGGDARNEKRGGEEDENGGSGEEVNLAGHGE